MSRLSNDHQDKAMHLTPIADRPPHGSLLIQIAFSITFIFGLVGITTMTLMATPLLLIPKYGPPLMAQVGDAAKDGFGKFLIVLTVFFAPSRLHITVDSPPNLGTLVERDARGKITKLNLPDRLVVIANHQAYTDWMYLWILASYAGHGEGVVILLKFALRKIPILGWGMQRFFKFIFMKRAWADDREHLTAALKKLGEDARSTDSETDEIIPLLPPSSKRSALWLFIFPEGTIISDEERVKSARYAKREETKDFVTMLHPRTTGLLFCLRSLLPQVPDLKLMDITIGYEGVPYGKYPQDYYGLSSIFFNSIHPPNVHLHLHLYEDLTSKQSEIPSLVPADYDPAKEPEEADMASSEEARAFELWLRNLWTDKEARLKRFSQDHQFVGDGGDAARETIHIRQIKWYHWIKACGGGGLITAVVLLYLVFR